MSTERVIAAARRMRNKLASRTWGQRDIGFVEWAELDSALNDEFVESVRKEPPMGADYPAVAPRSWLMADIGHLVNIGRLVAAGRWDSNTALSFQKALKPFDGFDFMAPQPHEYAPAKVNELIEAARELIDRAEASHVFIGQREHAKQIIDDLMPF